MATLRPSLDVVFKLLFAAERNRDLLVALLEAVLRPREPIVAIQVTNPEVERTTPGERGLTLDIVVEHVDGSRTDVEMQADNRGQTAERALYHWARLYSAAIVRGEDFSDLPACRVVFFVDFSLTGRFHTTFGAREARDGDLLSNHLQIDMVELPRFADAGRPEDGALRAWAAFIGAKSDEELRRVVMAHPEIEGAAEALERLSQDPEAQRLARLRQDELRWQARELAVAARRAREAGFARGREEGHEAGRAEGREEGREEGRAEGRAEGREAGREEGREEGLREAILSVCEVLGVVIDAARRDYVQTARVEDLEALRADLVRTRAWPGTTPGA